ncbi:MAG: hypothetical protein AAB799_00515 [Patescibacteria group bacterium]
MGEDIASIRSGQKPSGVDIPRKVTPEITRPIVEVPRPQAPSQSVVTPGSTIGLGKAEKTGPLPMPPSLKKPLEVPKPIIVQPPITVPTPKTRWSGFGGLNKKTYVIIGGIVVLGVFLYWFAVLRLPEPEVVVSPTPTFTVTPTPVAKNLNDIFAGTSANFEVMTANDIAGDFKTMADSLNIARNEFAKIELVKSTGDTLTSLTWLEMFDVAQTNYPIELKDYITDSLTVAYGQSESFNKDGSINFTSPSQGFNKVSFVAKVKDKASVETVMKNWESTAPSALAKYLSIGNISNEASVNFLDNSYRSTVIRYKNFPFPDITVDYAVVEAAGQSYLVISGSRESMYSVIDVLLEQ